MDRTWFARSTRPDRGRLFVFAFLFEQQLGFHCLGGVFFPIFLYIYFSLYKQVLVWSNFEVSRRARAGRCQRGRHIGGVIIPISHHGTLCIAAAGKEGKTT